MRWAWTWALIAVVVGCAEGVDVYMDSGSGRDGVAGDVADSAFDDCKDGLDCNTVSGEDMAETETGSAFSDSIDPDDVEVVTDAPQAPRQIPFVTPLVQNPYVDEPYLQEISHTIPEIESWVRALVTVRLPLAGMTGYDVPTQVTPRGFVVHDGENAALEYKINEQDPDIVAGEFIGNGLVLAGPETLYAVTGNGVEAVREWGRTVTRMVRGSSGDAWVIADGALGHLSADLELVWYAFESEITAVLDDGTFVLVATASDGVPRITGWYVDLTASNKMTYDNAVLHMLADDGLTTGPVRAMVADVTLPVLLDLVVIGDDGVLGLEVQSGGFSVVDVPEFVTGRVPLGGPIEAVKASDGGFIVAAEGGAYRIMDRGIGPEWRVYNEQRWIPQSPVMAVATDPDVPDGPIWFATGGGMSWVTAMRLDLDEKIDTFIDRVVQRHDRDGAVADSRLASPGDLSTNIPWDSDNDGGWTCYWVLAECFRYKATGHQDAKAHFDRSLSAMLSLQTLTGTDWFLARSVIRKDGCQLDDCDAPDDGEWYTSPDGEWWVKSDTSNDEVTSHMFMMGQAYELCADEDQKAQIRQHVTRIVGGIVDHGYQLFKPDGTCTSYGQFDPGYVNGVVGLFADGGRRSVQMLGALNVAMYVNDGDDEVRQRFLDAKRDLIENHHYDDNVVTESMAPGRQGHPDGDELAMQGFVPLLRYETDPYLYDKYMEGWRNSYSNMRLQQAALWDVVNAMLGGENPEFFNAGRWLKMVPMNLVRWPMHNIHRLDLAKPPQFYQRGDNMWARSDRFILPGDERPNIRHNGSQYQSEGGWGSTVELDGADVVYAYWSARYYNLIVPALP